MKTKNIISALAVVLMAMITMVSCEKSKTVETIDIATAEDDAIMDMAFDDVFSEVDSVMNTTGKRTRKGKIIITVSGPMWMEGSMRIVTLEDFYVNDHRIEGVRTVTNEGRHMEGEYEGKVHFSVVLDSGKVTTPDDIVITRQVNRTRTFVEGEESKWDTRDDIWYIEGIATGINRNGVAFTREISSPLWKEIGCRFITRGTVLISAEGRPDAILDYGDGECDAIATVTVGEESRTINLRRW